MIWGLMYKKCIHVLKGCVCCFSRTHGMYKSERDMRRCGLCRKLYTSHNVRVIPQTLVWLHKALKPAKRIKVSIPVTVLSSHCSSNRHSLIINVDNV